MPKGKTALVTDSEQIAHMVATTARRFGAVDIVVNNAVTRPLARAAR